MRLVSLQIKNFKSIRNITISDIENALILVGKNNTGKTSILDAIKAVGGQYRISEQDFNEKKQNIEITISLEITHNDMLILYEQGIVSQYKRYEIWKRDFESKLPSLENRVLSFVYQINREGKTRYSDGYTKDNHYIKEVFPKIYFIDTHRELQQIHEDLLMFQEDELLKQMRSGCCMFDRAKQCTHCFQCVGLINQKTPNLLNAFETAKLLEYKLYQMNLNEFTKKVNDHFRRNGQYMEEIRYTMECDMDNMFTVKAETYHKERDMLSPVEHLGKGTRSIYMLSLLEAYVDEAGRTASLIMIEEPEIFLHPKLQKISGEILYRLSKKNQVIFSTHSPNLLYNFSSKQIRQVVLDDDYYSVVKDRTNIAAILDDLGYTANDFLNVGFVFIVEGKQDKNKLPLLLNKYYSEMYNEEGNLSRISIITTNSCTNIKTYANLKYMNQIYLRDQFLMIRDSDGKNKEELANQLCKYYDERNLEDIDKLPKVTRKNVLILKYYSFENYFLNPSVMVQIGVLKKEEEFYTILFKKWQEYLYRLKSGRQLVGVLGKTLESVRDIKENIEVFKIYMRGHNLYDIFYGPYKENETQLLKQYIDIAPREDFQDILDAINRFVYFDSRRKR